MKNLDVNNFAPHSFADGLVVSHLPFGPTAYFTLSNTVMRHDIPKIGTMSEAYPHLIFHNFNSKLGERVSVEIIRVQLFEGQLALSLWVLGTYWLKNNFAPCTLWIVMKDKKKEVPLNWFQHKHLAEKKDWNISRNARNHVSRKFSILLSVNNKGIKSERGKFGNNQGPVVRRPTSANPRLNFYPGLFIPLFKSSFGVIFSILCGASYH